MVKRAQRPGGAGWMSSARVRTKSASDGATASGAASAAAAMAPKRGGGSNLHALCLAQRSGCTDAINLQLMQSSDSKHCGDTTRGCFGQAVSRVTDATPHELNFEVSVWPVLSEQLRSILPRRFEPTSLRAFAAESFSGR